MIDLNQIGHDIIGAAFEVRKQTGRFLLESFYVSALAHELRMSGHKVELEKLVTARYKGTVIKDAYRIDLLVDDCVVIECKSLNRLNGSEFNQINTYLELGGYKLGYIINFSAKDFSPNIWCADSYRDQGIIRVIR